MTIKTDAILSGLMVMGPQLEVGEGTFINHDCMFENQQAAIRIGSRCNIAMRTTITTATHELGRPEQRAGAEVKQPVYIEDGVWIGAGAIILPGVTVGRGCVIAAGAVVRDTCEPNGMYAGIPARRIRDLAH